MTTPNTQPTEHDKAIERDAEYLRLKDDASTGLDGSPGNTSKFAFETINTLIKRLKEVEKERDEFEHKISHLAIVGTTDTQFSTVAEMLVAQFHRWRKEEQEELTELRTGYKQALEQLKLTEFGDRHGYDNRMHCFYCQGLAPEHHPKCLTLQVLSTPLAIATMKGEV